MNHVTDHDPKLIERAARAAKILELHAEGLSERQIADQVGCSRSTVWMTLQRARAAARAAGVVTG